MFFENHCRGGKDKQAFNKRSERCFPLEVQISN
jgi:hypothetical protein